MHVHDDLSRPSESNPSTTPVPLKNGVARKPFAWTPERREFCRLFVQTHNCAEAYRRSHGSTDAAGRELLYQTLAKRGERLLKHPAIRNEIRSREGPFWRLFPLSGDGVLAEAAKLAFSNMGDYFDFTGDRVTLKKGNQIGRHAQAAIQQMKVKTRTVRKVVGRDAAGKASYQETVTQAVDLKLHAKGKSLETLAKVLGVGSSRDVLGELLEALPPELAAQVGNFLLPAIEAAEERSQGPRPLASRKN